MGKKEFYEAIASRPQFDLVIANQIITDDVVAIEVELWIGAGEYYTAKGVSRRDIRDPKNPEIAIKLALGRAIRQLGRDVLSDGQDLVRSADRVARKQAEASASLKKKRKKAAKQHK